MSLATHSTQAPAARKRGGGPAPMLRPTLLPAGRPAQSSGGDIKSLCCAAAGLFQPELRAPAGAYTPPTGVRRAPNLASTLRSPSRPHAQLVKGYGHQWKKAGEIAA